MAAEESYETQSERVNLLWFIAPIQLLLLVAVFTLPFGFDKKSSLGLDFGYLLLFVAAYVTAVLLGLGYAAFLARWGWFAAQLSVFLLAAGITWLVASGIVLTSRQNDDHRLPSRPPLSKGIDKSGESAKTPANIGSDDEAIRNAEETLAAPPTT